MGCQLFLYHIIRDFVNNPVERDILLMAYGFLDGYVDAANLTERRKKYCQNVGIRHSYNDMMLAKYWSDINKSLSHKENTIIAALTARLEKESSTVQRPPQGAGMRKHMESQ